MIALDANVPVRFLVQDGPDQARIANALFDQLTDADPGFVSREVLVELVIEAADEVWQGVECYRTEGFGFADLMIAAAVRRSGARDLVTFDSKAARQPDVRLLIA